MATPRGWTLTAAAIATLLFGVAAQPAPKAVDQPGVTADTIRVGGVVSKTNPINGDYAAAFDGAQAYFNMVNASGGMYGRELQLVAKRDDQVVSNKQEVQGLLEQDNVFAAVPVATIASFTGAEQLAKEGVPTFGWGINDEWTGPPNLFGLNGYNCSDCPTPELSVALKGLRRKRVAILAYNIPTATACVDVFERTLKKWPSAKVVYTTKSLTFGVADFSIEVQQMREKRVDAVIGCIDQNAQLNVAREVKKQGLHAIQLLVNGYDRNFAAPNKDVLAGSVIGVGFTPFETRPKPKGLVQFEKWMEKGGFEQNEVSMVGWLSADLFVQGLRDAGPDFTRRKVIDALNAPKYAEYTANGLFPGDDTVSHTTDMGKDNCLTYVEIQKDGSFKPILGKPGKPFFCVPVNPPKLPKPTYR